MHTLARAVAEHAAAAALVGDGGEPHACYVISHSIAKKQNLGTLARSCTAFNVKEVCRVDCIPTHQRLTKEKSGSGGLTREVDTPLPSNSPHDRMILRVGLGGSHGRWKRPSTLAFKQPTMPFQLNTSY